MADAREPETAAEARYKVGEICRLADVQPYVLRYWENEFPVLSADRNQPGPRMYTDRELGIIQRIKTLLYVEGFTIAGAKKRLDAELKGGAEPSSNGEDAGTAPVALPPPLPRETAPVAGAPESRPRRGRARPVTVPGSDEPALPQIFEEDVTDSDPEPEKKAKDLRTGVVNPVTDPRLPRVVSELRQLLEILSREP
jgi:DNA-binding transcriptional MerR regulator